MSEIIYTSYRDTECISNRSILYNAPEEEMTSCIEKMYLTQYKHTVDQIESKQAKLSEIREKIRDFPSTEENSVEYKNLQAFASRVSNTIDKLDHELSNLEQTVRIQQILKREKQKLIERERELGEKAIEKYYEDKMKEAEEFAKRYEESRAEAWKNKKQPIEQLEQEAPTGTGKGINYILFLLSLNAFSLVIPLIILEAPIWVICVVTLFLFMPAILMSKLLFLVSLHLYNIARPILYVCGLIVAVQGKQDFFAIAFYILLGLQALSIIKNFIYTTLNIFLLFTYKE